MPENSFIRTEGYRKIAEYASGGPVRYTDFDTETQTGLNLFALREDLDFAALENTLDKIVPSLPSLKRIFAAPIIRLRDSGEILPVEAVRIVNSKTLAHISVHSELWRDIKDDRLIPRKLLSIRYEDDYALYENIIFARTVDIILRFAAQKLSLLRDMLYANREMRFNLLERENHPSYFLALGKLHTGYLRDYDKYLLPIERCFEKLTAIEHALVPRLNMPVYKNCRKKGGNLPLKRTNIFRSQKDYRRLYSLAKFFSDIGLDPVSDFEEDRVTHEEYFAFCSMLCVFAAGHFNFKFDKNRKIDFKNINLHGSFADWRLNIKAVEGALLLSVKKESEYRILLCPMAEDADIEADERIKVSVSGEDGIRLSLYDIDSFRRIQQMLLRAMIYSDSRREICPFCGKELSETESGDRECGACRTVIGKLVCPETGKEYFSTDIKHFRKAKDRCGAPEGVFFYRNITPISEEGALCCPRCGKVH